MGEKESLNAEEKGMPIYKNAGKKIAFFFLKGMKIFWQGCFKEVKVKIGVLSILLMGSFGLGWFLGFKLAAPVKVKQLPLPRKPFESLMRPHHLSPKVKLPQPPVIIPRVPHLREPVRRPREPGIYRPVRRPDVYLPNPELRKPAILSRPPQMEFPALKPGLSPPLPEGEEE